MATETFYLTGTCEWAKVFEPDSKFNRFSVDLYCDETTLKKFKDSGAQTTIREGANGPYLRLNRPASKLIKDKVVSFGPPELLNKENKPWGKELIGNGSEITCKVVVYDTAKGKGTRLEAIRVENHVAYGSSIEHTEGVDDPF